MSYFKSYRVVPNSEKTPKVTVFLLTMLKKGVYFGKSARRNRFYQKKKCKFVYGRKIYLFQAELYGLSCGTFVRTISCCYV